MQLRSLPILLALAAAGAPLSAQASCEGNHLGPVYMQTSPGYLGGSFQIDLGSPEVPFGIGLLSVSDGFGPVFHPLIGTACLDMYSPFYQIFLAPLDGTGNFHLSVALPSEPALLGFPPIYGAPTALKAGQIQNGKTVPLYYTFPNAWTPTGDLPAKRAFMRATNLGKDPKDNRIYVFLSGGGDKSIVEPQAKADTWIYRPLDRTFLAGPAMSVQRIFHTQTLLSDGRILILGGNDAAGVCHASGEIYDHAAGTLTPIAPMSTPRSGHAATLLPDGRVFVSGGVADYQNAATALKAALDTAQSTAELYDPATNTWSPAANGMTTKRGGHAQVLWPDGRVLVVSGLNGGTVTFAAPIYETASFTPSCDWFNPATGFFSPAPSIPQGRAFFGASVLGNGQLLVSGGTITDVLGGGAVANAGLFRFDGATWVQLLAFPGLGQGIAFHTQETMADGRALIVGGFNGYLDYLTAVGTAYVCDGLNVTPVTSIGAGPGSPITQSPRGGHTMTRMWDGSFLVLGGIAGSGILGDPIDFALTTGFVYAP
jgi:Kelch motif protein